MGSITWWAELYGISTADISWQRLQSPGGDSQKRSSPWGRARCGARAHCCSPGHSKLTCPRSTACFGTLLAQQILFLQISSNPALSQRLLLCLPAQHEQALEGSQSPRNSPSVVRQPRQVEFPASWELGWLCPALTDCCAEEETQRTQIIGSNDARSIPSSSGAAAEDLQHIEGSQQSAALLLVPFTCFRSTGPGRGVLQVPWLTVSLVCLCHRRWVLLEAPRGLFSPHTPLGGS